MSEKRRYIFLASSTEQASEIKSQLEKNYDLVIPESLESGLQEIRSQKIDGLLFASSNDSLSQSYLHLIDVLGHMPDGLVILNPNLKILWANDRFLELVESEKSVIDQNFYKAFGTPEILGPDFCLFNTALGSGQSAKSVLRIDEKIYYEVHAKPVFHGSEEIPEYLVVVVRDVSEDILQRQKLDAIYQAGLELGDLSPDELLDMSEEDRIELLKSKILHYTEDLLEFETVELRIVNKETKQLDPLLAVGMEPIAADRALFANPEANGVTGFVAATGKSYLCDDTTSDPLYLPGAAGARSSLTVPLILHDEILGTFNVESPHPGAFDEKDLLFLELFSREIAVALNTLDLLAVEKMSTTTANAEKILSEVVNPVDEILNDTAWILERYFGHDPKVSDRLARVLKHTRDIKQSIQKAGQTHDLSSSSLLAGKSDRPLLKSKRILIADSDATVRRAGHELLGRFGCDVETAHNGEEALLMVRSFHYDAVIIDIRLSDMTGYECFVELKKINEHISVILMTGFGYDPSHSIVKSRQEGLKSVLYKPFRLDQLLSEVEKAVSSPTDLDSEE